jgi:hypothetical protein
MQYNFIHRIVARQFHSIIGSCRSPIEDAVIGAARF